MSHVQRLVRRSVFIGAGTAILLSGCATRSRTGAVVGAAGGAVVGGVIGKVAGSTAKGAIVGAVLGGAAGAVIGSRMDKQAGELQQSITGAKVERVGEGIQVTFDSGLLFDSGSEGIRPEAGANLTELAKSLNEYPGTDVVIVGHTDERGSEGDNQALSERRARVAADYLGSQGVSASRITTRGLGETEPVASNETESGRQANRRIEVAIYASKSYRASVASAGGTGGER